MSSFVIPVEWKLSPVQTSLFRLLLRSDVMTVHAAMMVIYGSAVSQPKSQKVIGAHMHHLRKKMKPLGVDIITIPRTGWSLLGRKDFVSEQEQLEQYMRGYHDALARVARIAEDVAMILVGKLAEEMAKKKP